MGCLIMKKPTKDPKPAAEATAPARTPSRKHGTTRESLLDAGLQLFGQKGVDGVSIKDIETAVGLTPGRGSFYRHFESKEALLAAVVHREVEKLRHMRNLQQRGISGSLGNRRAELIVDFRMRLVVLDQIRPFINLLGREYGRFPDLLEQLYGLLVEESLAAEGKDLARDIAEKKVRGGDADALAAVIQSALIGFHLSKTYFGSQPYGIDDDRFIKALVDQLIPQEQPATDAGERQ
jgi:AcrR family transcriptional regulator